MKTEKKETISMPSCHHQSPRLQAKAQDNFSSGLQI
jgi:hypothetical protein